MNCTWNWISEMFFEPSEKRVQIRVNPPTIFVTVWRNRNIFHAGFDTGHIPEDKPPRRVLG